MAENVTPFLHTSVDATTVFGLRMELLQALDSARDDLQALLGYVLAKVPLDREGRLKAYELRISLEQRVQAVRWRLSTELLALPVAPGDTASRVAACNDELSDECSSLESEGERAWLHLSAVLQAVPPLNEVP